MSVKSQQANMKTIYSLVSQELGYIYGERESGPNGAKKQFLSKSAAFLRALGNDLGLKEFKVTTSPGGIAVSGAVSLMGVWGDGNGLYLQIFQSMTESQDFLFRGIKDMEDYSGGYNQWLPCSLFAAGDYEKLINTLSSLKKPLEQTEVERRAA